MERNKKSEQQQEFFRLQKKLSENWKAQRALGYKPLDKPIHHGYNGYWTLREDIARRQDADTLQYFLDTFGLSCWCKDIKFKQRSYLSKKLVDLKPDFKSLTVSQYEKLIPAIKKFFVKSETPYWGNQRITVYKLHLPHYYLKMKIVKSYKTHYKVVDKILLQEADELEFRLKTTFYNLYCKYYQRHSSNTWYRRSEQKKERRFNNQIIKSNLTNISGNYEEISDYLPEFKNQVKNYW